MEVDYYKILQVAENAELNAIKAAYRRRAMECHPDRGGNHEQMLLVNEAFQILSDPVSRRHYDAMRADSRDQHARDIVHADTARARERAKEYPSDWAEFERWLDGILNNVRIASVSGVGAVPMPTAGSSVSGWACIIGGMVIAVMIGNALFPDAPAILIMISIAAGAWSGKLIHHSFRSQSLDAMPHTSTASVIPAVVSCPNCAQKLRVSTSDAAARLRCRSCGNEFKRTV